MAATRQDSLGFLLADVSRLMRRAFKERLRGSSLTQAQARALVYIARNEGVRQVDLAELLEVQPITLARVLDHLAKAGLVERRADPRDRRVFRVHLKAAAAPHLAEIERVASRIRGTAFRDLSPKQAELVHKALCTMRENLAS